MTWGDDRKYQVVILVICLRVAMFCDVGVHLFVRFDRVNGARIRCTAPVRHCIIVHSLRFDIMFKQSLRDLDRYDDDRRVVVRRRVGARPQARPRHGRRVAVVCLLRLFSAVLSFCVCFAFVFTRDNARLTLRYAVGDCVLSFDVVVQAC